MSIRTEAGGARVIVCAGDFDMDTLAGLSAACEREAESSRRLVIDVTGVTFADSSFLNVLITWRKRLPVALLGPLPSRLRFLLEITGALELFEVRDHA
ncbi:STAS domain-containing protein [Streptomyces sp. NPDC058279]|uniref:STAS domain-containing protein n=1 Tax=Streptomyces sp. NPDC058279 TaxID=3346418 RepID=UPI0036E87F75